MDDHNINFEDFKKGIKLFKEIEGYDYIIRRIRKLTISMLRKTPFWSHILASVDIIVTDEINDIGIDYNYLYVNPDFIEDLDDQHLYQSLYHVCTHLLLDHLVRGVKAEEDAWIPAIEISTTLVLDQIYKDILESAKYSSDNFQIFRMLQNTSSIIAKKFKNLSTEEIYNKLLDNLQNSQQNMGGSGNMNNDILLQQAQSQTECSMEQVMEEYKKQVPQTIQELQSDKNKGLISKSLEKIEDKQMGFLPAQLIEKMEKELKPTIIEWTRVLEKYIQPILMSDISWSRPSKSMLANNIIMPGVVKENITVVVALDTSGSISSSEYNIFLSELHGILTIVDNLSIVMIDCDTEVQNIDIINNGEKPYYDVSERLRMGGGGTSFVPVFDWVEQAELEGTITKPDLLIYFTDLYGTFPNEEPDYPTFWLTTTSDMKQLIKVPFGEIIKYIS